MPKPLASSSDYGSEMDPIPSEEVSELRAAYNLVSDTVTGVNVRWSDNKFQALFIVSSMMASSVLGSALGLVFGELDVPWFVGTLIGAFAGIVIGVFASGIYLMLYRAFRHILGRHD